MAAQGAPASAPSPYSNRAQHEGRAGQESEIGEAEQTTRQGCPCARASPNHKDYHLQESESASRIVREEDKHLYIEWATRLQFKVCTLEAHPVLLTVRGLFE